MNDKLYISIYICLMVLVLYTQKKGHKCNERNRLNGTNKIGWEVWRRTKWIFFKNEEDEGLYFVY